MRRAPQRHFIIEPPAPGDERPRNAFGVLIGFGAAYAEYYRTHKPYYLCDLMGRATGPAKRMTVDEMNQANRDLHAQGIGNAWIEAERIENGIVTKPPAPRPE